MKRAGSGRGTEWVGGIVAMPAYVTGEGEPYRPETLLWMGPTGAVLGSATGKPGEVLALANDSLNETIARPMYGPPHRPKRVRVASPELAAVLHDGQPDIDVIYDATPELDELYDRMRGETPEGCGTQSYVSHDVTPEAMGALFAAAADLYRADPWQAVPYGSSLLLLTIEQLGVHEAAIVVFGREEPPSGILMFADRDDLEAYLNAIDHGTVVDSEQMPEHITLGFQPAAGIPPELREEITTHGWEVASADAYPWLLLLDSDLVTRPPSTREVTVLEALARALAAFVSDADNVRAVNAGGEPLTRTLSVATHAGELSVTLQVPYSQELDTGEERADILADLQAHYELARGTLDAASFEAVAAVEDELFERFKRAPEGVALRGTLASALLTTVAMGKLDQTIVTLRAPELRHALFELLPQTIVAEPRKARAIVDELRAFYAFLGRELGLEQAAECMEVLDDGAVEKLEAALSDPSNRELAAALGMPELSYALADQPYGVARRQQRGSRRARQQQRNKRKAARKARKKNR